MNSRTFLAVDPSVAFGGSSPCRGASGLRQLRPRRQSDAGTSQPARTGTTLVRRTKAFFLSGSLRDAFLLSPQKESAPQKKAVLWVKQNYHQTLNCTACCSSSVPVAPVISHIPLRRVVYRVIAGVCEGALAAGRSSCSCRRASPARRSPRRRSRSRARAHRNWGRKRRRRRRGSPDSPPRS